MKRTIGKWTITEELAPNGVDIRVKVSDGWHSDWPIRYWDGRVVWDQPELIPQRVKSAAAKMLKDIADRQQS